MAETKLSRSDYFRLLPLGYPVLVIIGLMNLDFYYNGFNISVVNFLTLSEILTSFAAFGYSIFFSSLIILIFIWYSHLYRNDGGSKFKVPMTFIYKEIFTIHFFVHLRNLTYRLSKKRPNPKIKSAFKIFMTFIFMIDIFVVFTAGLITIISVTALMNRGVIPFNLFNFTFTQNVLILFLTVLIISRKNTFLSEIFLSKNHVINGIVYIFLVCGYFNYLQKSKVVSKLKNENITAISFNYLNIPITSNKDTIFIGTTENYIFLRSKRDSINFVYEKSNITNLQFKEN